MGPGKADESDSELALDKSPGRHSSPLMKIAWERIVLDEAHMIKNYTRSASLHQSRVNQETRGVVGATGRRLCSDFRA